MMEALDGSRKPRVIPVLGCGPAGLLAAHAVAQQGLKPMIFSKKAKSRMGGAQFLHASVPELTPEEPEMRVRYTVRGDPYTYAKKVYGTTDVPVSFMKVRDGELQPAWNLTKLYDILWERYERDIVDTPLGPAEVEGLTKTCPVVLSAVPLVSICSNPGLHKFPSQPVWIYPDNVTPCEDGEIIYDGTEDFKWYRQSNLWGWRGTEYGASLKEKPPLPGVIQIQKPLTTNCDCWPKVARLGRFGSWKKEALTHEAYWQAVDVLAYEFGPREVHG